MAQTQTAQSATSAAPGPSLPTAQALAKDVWLISGGFPDKRQPDGNTVVFEGVTVFIVLDTGRHRWQRQAIPDFARTDDLPVMAIVNGHWQGVS